MAVKGWRKENLVGRRFGLLTVIAQAESKKRWQSWWLCRCECGVEKAIRATGLMSGDTRTCGNQRLHRRTPASERFHVYVSPEPNSGCWLWTGSCAVDRYGRPTYGRLGVMVGRRQKTFRATQVAWEIYRGPVPPGAWILHKCDLPLCANPQHLFLGDHAANTADKISKDRQAKGERTNIAAITATDVETIRDSYVNGQTQAILARKYGIRQTQVSNIVRGLCWKHLPNPTRALRRRAKRRTAAQPAAP